VKLSGFIEKETDEALLLKRPRGDQHWLPFSQILSITRFKDRTAVVNITDWLARKLELEDKDEQPN
jgi:hypothetical protein